MDDQTLVWWDVRPSNPLIYFLLIWRKYQRTKKSSPLSIHILSTWKTFYIPCNISWQQILATNLKLYNLSNSNLEESGREWMVSTQGFVEPIHLSRFLGVMIVDLTPSIYCFMSLQWHCRPAPMDKLPTKRFLNGVKSILNLNYPFWVPKFAGEFSLL